MTAHAATAVSRLRVIDLFRHWEGGEGGEVSVEHFRAGLHGRRKAESIPCWNRSYLLLPTMPLATPV